MYIYIYIYVRMMAEVSVKNIRAQYAQYINIQWLEQSFGLISPNIALRNFKNV